MQFGVCTGPENLSIVESAGYDFIELGFSGCLSPEKPEADVMPGLLSKFEKSRVKAQAYNGMLPGDLRVTGGDIDFDRQNAYLKSGFSRASKLGGKVVVFGSGAARRVPDGFSRDEAYRQIREFLTRAGDAAAEAGIVVAVEPLNVNECNILTSVAETTVVVEEVNHPAVQVLSDLFHVAHDSQSFDETAQAGSRLAHVHIASCPSRQNPTSADEQLLRDYFRAVRAAGYDARISIEAGWSNLAADAAAALNAIRAAWVWSAA